MDIEHGCEQGECNFGTKCLSSSASKAASVKKRNRWCHLLLFSRDTAWMAELLQHFVSTFGLNKHLQFLPTHESVIYSVTNPFSADQQQSLSWFTSIDSIFLRLKSCSTLSASPLTELCSQDKWWPCSGKAITADAGNLKLKKTGNLGDSQQSMQYYRRSRIPQMETKIGIILLEFSWSSNLICGSICQFGHQWLAFAFLSLVPRCSEILCFCIQRS